MMKQTDSVSFGEMVARLFWMMVGPLTLLALAYAIVKAGEGWLNGVDIAFLAVLAGMLLARWLEFRGGNPRTADGEPATIAHLRRYWIGAALVGLGVWLLANSIANHLLVL